MAMSIPSCASTQAIASWETSQPLSEAISRSFSTTARLVWNASPRKAEDWARQSESSNVVFSSIVPVSSPDPRGL